MIPFVCPAFEPCFTNFDSMQRESLLQGQKILVLTFPASLTPGAQACYSCSSYSLAYDSHSEPEAQEGPWMRGNFPPAQRPTAAKGSDLGAGSGSRAEC